MVGQIEEKVERQIERIESLMQTLSIKEDNPNEVIFDYHSEDEIGSESENDDFLKVKIEEETRDWGEGTSKPTKDKGKAKMEEQPFEKMTPKWADRKFKNVRPQYVPRTERVGIDILNIDCAKDTRKTIEDWYYHIRVIIGLDENINKLNIEEIYNYIVHKMSGIAREHFNGLNRERLLDALKNVSNKLQLIDAVFSELIREFVGIIQNSEEFQEGEILSNFWVITNLKICNMCYLDEFICEFREAYYKLDEDRKKTAREILFTKLPKNIGQEIRQIFGIRLLEGTAEDTLGSIIYLIKEWLKHRCTERIKKKEAKIALCCEEERQKRRKYRKEKKWKKTKPKFFKKNFKRKRFFRKKPRYEKKDKYCPKGKKSCKCWLCQEEGHYANECPKRDKQKKESRTLRSIVYSGFEPIEDKIDFSDSEEEIYYLDESSSSEEEVFSSEEDSD